MQTRRIHVSPLIQQTAEGVGPINLFMAISYLDYTDRYMEAFWEEFQRRQTVTNCRMLRYSVLWREMNHSIIMARDWQTHSMRPSAEQNLENLHAIMEKWINLRRRERAQSLAAELTQASDELAGEPASSNEPPNGLSSENGKWGYKGKGESQDEHRTRTGIYGFENYGKGGQTSDDKADKKTQPCWRNQTQLNGGWTCGFENSECSFNHDIQMTKEDFDAVRVPRKIQRVLDRNGAPRDLRQRAIDAAKAADGYKGGDKPKGVGKGRGVVAGGKAFCMRKLCQDQSCIDTKDHSIMAKHLQATAAIAPKSATPMRMAQPYGGAATQNPFDPIGDADDNDFDIPNRDDECVVCNKESE